MNKAPVDTPSSNAALAETGQAKACKPPSSRPLRILPKAALRWLPGPNILREYKKGWLRKDIFSGLVLTAILVPAGWRYAEASGLPAITGLYATIVR